MFIKLDRYFEEMFKVRLCAENARARIESLRLARDRSSAHTLSFNSTSHAFSGLDF